MAVNGELHGQHGRNEAGQHQSEQQQAALKEVLDGPQAKFDLQDVTFKM
jgi:hypothetical protein